MNGSEDRQGEGEPPAGTVVRLARPVPAADSPSSLPPSEPAETPAPQALLDLPALTLPAASLRLPPATGVLAVTFGIVGLIKVPILFGPLALLFALAAGLQRQFWYAAVGGAMGAAALLTSTTFWMLAGFGWLATYLL